MTAAENAIHLPLGRNLPEVIEAAGPLGRGSGDKRESRGSDLLATQEARQLRDTEVTDPGVIRRSLDARLQQGQEPTKAAVRMEQA
ncbi:hypothetical protein [Methylobacterium sp. CM6257]